VNRTDAEAIVDRMQEMYQELDAALHSAEVVAVKMEAISELGAGFERAPRHTNPFRYLRASDKVAEQRRQLAKNIFRDVKELVGEGCAIGSTPLVVDDEGLLREKWLPERRVADGFSPRAVFDDLWRATAPSATQDASRQVANAFIRAFCLRPGKDVKRVGGSIVLEVRVYECTIFKSEGQKQYSSDQPIREGVVALAGVLSMMEPSQTDRLSRELGRMPRTFYPGCRPAFTFATDGGNITVNTFLGKAEFRLPAEMALGINAFVAEHGTTWREAA
jgi:hypothetical protein